MTLYNDDGSHKGTNLVPQKVYKTKGWKWQDTQRLISVACKLYELGWILEVKKGTESD